MYVPGKAVPQGFGTIRDFRNPPVGGCFRTFPQWVSGGGGGTTVVHKLTHYTKFLGSRD